MPLRNAEIKIILYSACLTDEIKQQARELGVAACVDKPFDLDALRKIMDGGE